jgi:signal transduction histidine kinase
MLGADGKVSHIVQRLEDVTGTAQMQLVQDLSMAAVPAPALAASGCVPRSSRALEDSAPSLLFVGMRDPERSRLRAGFEDAGYRVAWASNDDEALALCGQARPDCIVMELSTPDLADLRLCRGLREQPGCAHAAILCLAARRDTAVLDRALLAGADEVLEKPVTALELRRHVQALLLQQPGMTEAVRAHCQSLRQQRLRLWTLQQQRERIASYIVHDLKEPLSTIDLRAALLLLDTSLTEQARTFIERIRTQVRSALLQVLNLLDIRMLDEGLMEARCEPVDLLRMVRELLTDFDPRAQARALTLRSDIEVPQVFADPDLLRRTLANLLDNAIRHAPNSSEVAITAHRIAGARVELRVIDGGSSIPPAMAERIFDAYVQAEDTPYRSRTGRGLGLAFCKLAVQAHHGEIAVSTIRDRTVFDIKLPENYG